MAFGVPWFLAREARKILYTYKHTDCCRRCGIIPSVSTFSFVMNYREVIEDRVFRRVIASAFVWNIRFTCNRWSLKCAEDNLDVMEC